MKKIPQNINILFIVLKVSLGFIIPLENFSLIWRRHHYRWRAANFDLSMTLKAIEQWGFFSVPLLLLHGASVYNGHLRGPLTLTPIASRAVTTCFYDSSLLRLGFEHPTFRLRGQRSNPLRHRRGEKFIKYNIMPLSLCISCTCYSVAIY